MPDFRQYLSIDYWRAHKLELAYLVFGFILFLVFLFATFPYPSALKGALGPLGLRFESTGQQFAFPFGARLTEVTVRSSSAPGGPPMFEADSVKIWPALGSFLLFHPGVAISADAYGGALRASIHRKGDGAAVSFSATKVDLAALQILRLIGGSLGGELTGDGDISFDPLTPAEDAGTTHLTAKGFSLRIPVIRHLQLGDLELSAHLENGIIHVEQLKSSGGDLAVDGNGTIKLAPTDWHQSELAMRLALVPSPTARQHLAPLMNFLPHPPGPTPYKLGGTIASPLIS